MKTACYVRVSTADQNLDRQIQSTADYAQQTLDVDLADIEVYQDKSTGTDTARDGYKQHRTCKPGQIDAVVVHEISRLARLLQDLERTVSTITESDAALHFVRDGLSFGDGKDDPVTRLQMQMLGAFAEWQARVKPLAAVVGALSAVIAVTLVGAYLRDTSPVRVKTEETDTV